MVISPPIYGSAYATPAASVIQTRRHQFANLAFPDTTTSLSTFPFTLGHTTRQPPRESMRMSGRIWVRVGIPEVPDTAGKSAPIYRGQVELARQTAALCQRGSEDLWEIW